jgi:signal transduction histidine kinase
MRLKQDNGYKVITAELGVDPFRVLNSFFVLVGVIPLLVFFYLIVKEKLTLQLFLGNNGFILGIAIFIAILGYSSAYIFIRRMMENLMNYARERKMADNEKSEVMLALSHDIKNPLMTIKLSMDNLNEGIGGQLSSSQSGIVEICLANVAKIIKFIEELLSSSRDEFKRMTLESESVDLSALLKSEIANFNDLARNSGKDLQIKIAAGSMCLWADKVKLARVINNLISNAIKYTPAGGTIEAELFQDKNVVTFLVRNSGPGIKPEELEFLFKKFRRLEKHSQIAGTGLGLTIVKDIVDLHSGHITVKSDPGKSTEFKVVLPRNLESKNA